jgi:hypothetical protein
MKPGHPPICPVRRNQHRASYWQRHLGSPDIPICMPLRYWQRRYRCE